MTYVVACAINVASRCNFFPSPRLSTISARLLPTSGAFFSLLQVSRTVRGRQVSPQSSRQKNELDSKGTFSLSRDPPGEGVR